MIFFFFKDVYILYREAQYRQIKGSQMQNKKKRWNESFTKKKKAFGRLKELRKCTRSSCDEGMTYYSSDFTWVF